MSNKTRSRSCSFMTRSSSTSCKLRVVYYFRRSKEPGKVKKAAENLFPIGQTQKDENALMILTTFNTQA